MASLANVYRLIDDYANTSTSGVGTGADGGVPVSPDFTATSLAIAQQQALLWATMFNRPCRLVPVGGSPPYTLFTPGTVASPPVAALVLPGTISVTNGSAAVVGTSTLFTKQLSVGAQVQVANQLGTVYAVATITDDTHLTLGVVFSGTTNASTTLQSIPGALVAIAGSAVGVTNASASVTGTGTTFTALSVGQNIQFGNQTGTNYTILSITDATHLTLTSTFTGSTNASTTLLIAPIGY